MQARIISIADAYDAMTRYRTYKTDLTKEEAIIELKKYAGIQFDPDIVSVSHENACRKLCTCFATMLLKARNMAFVREP